MSSQSIHIFLIEGFYGGSHKHWADGLKKHSKNKVTLFTLKDKNWKWRMHGGAITLSDKVNTYSEVPNLFICTDMIDVALFKSLLKTEYQDIPILTYFHESQLTYPNSNNNEVEQLYHYAFINYTTALVSDFNCFNSRYHLDSFLEALPHFLKMYPSPRNIQTIQKIKRKSEVLHLGLELKAIKEKNQELIFLWNHRWEYDKNPAQFFDALIRLKSENYSFGLIVLGEATQEDSPQIRFYKEELREEIIHWGYAESRRDYLTWLTKASVIPITSHQDFFGISMIEAIDAGCYPILPNRLAFPELIENERYFYKNDSEFYPKLKEVIDTKAYSQVQEKLINSIQRYSWSNQIEKYDKKFKEIGSKKRGYL